MKDELKIDMMLDNALKTPDEKGLKMDFSLSVMLRIQRNKKRVQDQKRFFIIIASIFAGISIILTGYIFYSVIQSVSTVNSAVINDSVTYIKSWSDSIARLFPKSDVSIFGSFISLGLLISAWFYFDLNKGNTSR